MKKNIGSKLALYPMPITVVGSVSGNKTDKSDVFSYEVGDAGALKIVLGIKRFLLYLLFVMVFSFITGMLVNIIV